MISPNSSPSRSISAALVSCIGRSAGAGPWRRVSTSRPPGFRRVTSLRKARCRSAGTTCIHTALSQTRSNIRPRRCTASRPGRRSLSQRIGACGCRCWPSRRIPSAGSTATTSQPLTGEPAGIAARAGADVEDEARPFRDEVEHVPVAVLERQALVELGELAGLSVVGCYGIAHGQQGATLDLHPAHLASNDQQ